MGNGGDFRPVRSLACALTWWFVGSPNGIRTRVATLRGLIVALGAGRSRAVAFAHFGWGVFMVR
jgi:hypothetical protein